MIPPLTIFHTIHEKNLKHNMIINSVSFTSLLAADVRCTRPFKDTKPHFGSLWLKKERKRKTVRVINKILNKVRPYSVITVTLTL